MNDLKHRHQQVYKNMLALLLMCFSLSSFAAIPTFEGKLIDLANISSASLYKQDNTGQYQLITQQLDNVSAYENYRKLGHYKLQLPFRLDTLSSEDIWLQIRGGQPFRSIKINNTEIDSTFHPLKRIRLNRSQLVVGVNLLSIEFMISHESEAQVFRDLILSPLSTLHQESIQFSLASLSFACLFIMLFLMSICFYFAFQRHTVLLFSSLFYLLTAATALPSALFWLQELNLFLYGESLTVFNYLIGVTYLLLNLSFTTCKKRLKLTVVLCAVLIAWLLPLPTFFVFGSATFLALLCILQREISPLHIGMLLVIPIITAIDSFNVFDANIAKLDSAVLKSFLYQIDYLAFSLFALYLMVFFISRWQQNVAKHHAIRLQKKNLELQLVNKHIQPHFLMNALMSIQQQVEESPQDSIEMIDLLAEEFVLLHQQIGKELVPLHEELTMCHSLLKFMAKKQQAHYELTIINDVHHIFVPPGILFTCLENGLKHGYCGNSEGKFTVSCNINNDTLTLVVENDGRQQSQSTTSSGLGLKFVKQQLELWQPARWTFYSVPSTTGWKNLITVDRFVNKAPI